MIDPDVPALRPAELLQSLPEYGDVGLSLRGVLGIGHQHADAPHPIRLLRVRCKRHHRRATESRDKLAPLHVSPKAQDEAS